MVHANLNWTFGPFKYLFSSPVFHRWHHTAQEEGMDKNFAPTFPLLDVMFGTFYMPDGKVPTHYGVPGSDIPDNFLGQISWAFKRR
jgi:sterol desaturase/sphingolipid hydroxylase (fatty acid hydroxylase superfamily)